MIKDRSDLVLELNNPAIFLGFSFSCHVYRFNERSGKNHLLTGLLLSIGLGRFQVLPIDSDPGKTFANIKRAKMQKKALRSMAYFEESLVIFSFDSFK